MFLFVPVHSSGLCARAQTWVSTTSAQFASEWRSPYMVREGNRNCRSFLFFSSQLCPYLVYGRKTFSAVLTSPTSLFWAADRASYSIHSPPSRLLQSRRFVSSIFRNVCRVGVFSQGCLSAHINAGACADTESAVVKEERMSGMTLHTAVMKWLVSPHRESCSRAVVQTLTASCKLRISEWNTVRHHFLFLCRAVWYQLR